MDPCIGVFLSAASLLIDKLHDVPCRVQSGVSEVHSLPSIFSCDHPRQIKQGRIERALGVHVGDLLGGGTMKFQSHSIAAL